MRHTFFFILVIILASCQSKDQDQTSTPKKDRGSTIKKDTTNATKNKVKKTPKTVELKHPSWLYEYDNKSTGKIYMFFTPEEKKYQLDMFIYDKKGTQSLFARLGFKGTIPADSTIFKLPVDDLFFSNIKTSDGIDMPFPVEQSPNVSIDLNSKALVLPNRFLYPSTSIRLTQRDSLIALQKKWKGENVVFK